MLYRRLLVRAGFALAVPLVACVPPEADQSADAPPPARGLLHHTFGAAAEGQVHGYAAPGAPETDERPVFRLYLGTRALGIDALDAVVDDTTGTLVWVTRAGALRAAALPAHGDELGKERTLAQRVIPGLAASRGQVAFATRIDGPETAVFIADLRTANSRALHDAPGPDEVLAFSPDGGEVLVLSGRTGLASLFALTTAGTRARQLTNRSLAPGPGLDVAAVIPSPMDARRVVWGAGGIAYRAHQEVIKIGPAGRVTRLPRTAELVELVR